MSDQSSDPETSVTPAATIWEQFELIRGWIGIVFLFPLLLCALPLFGAFVGLARHGVTIVPQVFVEPLVIYPFLIGTLSAISCGLSQGMFGTGRRALVVAFAAGLFWLVLVADCILVLYHVAGSLRGMLNLWTAAAWFVSSIPLGSMFFIAYLLWRTNNDA